MSDFSIKCPDCGAEMHIDGSVSSKIEEQRREYISELEEELKKSRKKIKKRRGKLIACFLLFGALIAGGGYCYKSGLYNEVRTKLHDRIETSILEDGGKISLAVDWIEPLEIGANESFRSSSGESWLYYSLSNPNKDVAVFGATARISVYDLNGNLLNIIDRDLGYLYPETKIAFCEYIDAPEDAVFKMDIIMDRWTYAIGKSALAHSVFKPLLVEVQSVSEFVKATVINENEFDLTNTSMVGLIFRDVDGNICNMATNMLASIPAKSSVEVELFPPGYPIGSYDSFEGFASTFMME